MVVLPLAPLALALRCRAATAARRSSSGAREVLRSQRAPLALARGLSPYSLSLNSNSPLLLPRSRRRRRHGTPLTSPPTARRGPGACAIT